LAARAFVHDTFLTAGSTKASANLDVQVKGTLAHKGGAKDMVTAADIAVQEVIVTALTAPQYRSRVFNAGHGAGAGKLPYEIVGEEELDETTAAVAERRLEAYGRFIDAAEKSPEYEALAALLPAGPPERWPDASDITVFVDPIDATLAFIDGCRVAPMTLIGIASRGVPVAGLASRVFSSDDSASDKLEFPSALSLCVETGPCVLWGQRLHQTLPQAGKSSGLRGTFSGSTKAAEQATLLGMLRPFEDRPARGGGNKILMVAQAAAKLRGGSVSHPHSTSTAARKSAPNADFFVSSTGLKMWDTCGPHAFLRWLGGDVYTVKRTDQATALEELRYDHRRHGTAVTRPGRAIMAVSGPEVRDECLRRMKSGMSRL
jgi:3'-phosphoadenosine 5'-phosphosulfate (PAPS) 3'-phosphatase